MSMLSGRARRVLERFPRHMDAAVPGKLIGAVTQALVRDQDIQAADIQAIRRSHRLYEASELYDLLQLAGLHGLQRSEMALLFARHSKAKQLLAQLEENVTADADLQQREQLANAFLALWSLPGEEPLRWFAINPDSEEPLDLASAVQRLLTVAQLACRNAMLLEAIRTRIATTARIHIIGNG